MLVCFVCVCGRFYRSLGNKLSLFMTVGLWMVLPFCDLLGSRRHSAGGTRLFSFDITLCQDHEFKMHQNPFTCILANRVLRSRFSEPMFGHWRTRSPWHSGHSCGSWWHLRMLHMKRSITFWSLVAWKTRWTAGFGKWSDDPSLLGLQGLP